MGVVRLDGWAIKVDWYRLYRGDSFFVPSVNLSYDLKQIEDDATKFNCVISTKVVVEDEIQGIRVWVKRPVI